MFPVNNNDTNILTPNFHKVINPLECELLSFSRKKYHKSLKDLAKDKNISDHSTQHRNNSKLPGIKRLNVNSRDRHDKSCDRTRFKTTGDNKPGPSRITRFPAIKTIKNKEHSRANLKPSLIPRRILPTRKNEIDKIQDTDLNTLARNRAYNQDIKDVQRIQVLNNIPDLYNNDQYDQTSITLTRPIPTLGYIYNDLSILDNNWTDLFIEADANYIRSLINSVDTNRRTENGSLMTENPSIGITEFAGHVSSDAFKNTSDTMFKESKASIQHQKPVMKMTEKEISSQSTKTELNEKIQSPVTSTSEKTKNGIFTDSYIDYPSEVLQKSTDFETAAYVSSGTNSNGDLTRETYSSVNTLDNDDQSVFEEDSCKGWWPLYLYNTSCDKVTKDDVTWTRLPQVETCVEEMHETCRLHRHCTNLRNLSSRRFERHGDHKVLGTKHHNRKWNVDSNYNGSRHCNSMRKRWSFRGVCRRRWDYVRQRAGQRWAKWSKSPLKTKKFPTLDSIQRSVIWSNKDLQMASFLRETGTDAKNGIENSSKAIAAPQKCSLQLFNDFECGVLNVSCNAKHVSTSTQDFSENSCTLLTDVNTKKDVTNCPNSKKVVLNMGTSTKDISSKRDYNSNQDTRHKLRYYVSSGTNADIRETTKSVCVGFSQTKLNHAKSDEKIDVSIQHSNRKAAADSITNTSRKSESVFTSRVVLPTPFSCRKNCYSCDNHSECLFVYGQAKCVVHTMVKDAGTQSIKELDADGTTLFHTGRYRSSSSAATSKFITTPVFYLPRSVQTPPASIKLPKIITTDSASYTSVPTSVIDTATDTNKGNTFPTSGFSSSLTSFYLPIVNEVAKAPTESIISVRTDHSACDPIAISTPSVIFTSKCHVCGKKNHAVYKNNVPTFIPCSKNSGNTSGLLLKNHHVPSYHVRREFLPPKVTGQLAPSMKESLNEVPSTPATKRPMKPSCYDFGCQTHSPRAKKINRAMSCCVLNHAFSVTNIGKGCERDLRSVYFMLTAIEGRIRRLKQKYTVSF